VKHSGVSTVIALAAAFAAGSAWAQAGVTSATDGQPPMQQTAGPARILSFGTDIQAGQRLTTGTQERAHVVFVDGTSLTVGPNGALVIEKYAYDPQRKTGEMTVNATQGAFRFVGGAISKSADVTIKTPSATIGIRGGIAAFAVSENGATTANFLYGNAMRVTGQGMTQTATRIESQITVPTGGSPTRPILLQPGQLLGSATIPPATVGRPTRSSIDDAVAKSDLAKHNSQWALRQDSAQQGKMSSQQELARTVTMATKAAIPSFAQQPPAAIRPTIATPAPAIATPSSTASVASTAPIVASATAPRVGGPIGGAAPTRSGGTLTLSGSATITRIGGVAGATIVNAPLSAGCPN
jgi:hypothetical protein